MSTMRVMSVAVPGTLAQARALARGLRTHHPDWSYEVVLIGPANVAAGEHDELRVVSVHDVLNVDVPELLARHDPARLVSLLVPRVLEERSAESPEPILHLPASTWILDSLTPLARGIDQRGVLLVPRLLGDVPGDGLEPSHTQLAMAGRIAAEVIGVDCAPPSRSFLRWWIQRADAVFGGFEGRPRPHDGEDWQWLLRMLELAPTRFSVTMLEDPGCNVSVWNLHERTLDETPAGIVVDGEWPLRFMDMPGFEPDHPYRLNPTSSRLRLSRLPILGALARRYAGEVMDAGWRDVRSRVGIGGRLANGIVFDETMSSLHETGTVGHDFGDLSSAQGTEAFMSWLREAVPPWASEGISRYALQRVITERADVTAAFPDMYGLDSTRFAKWWRTSGREEMNVPEELLAPTAEFAAGTATADAASALSATAGAVGALTTPAAATLERPAPRNLGPAPTTAAVGVRVTGYLSHILGLGSAARGYASALAAAGVPLTTVSVPLDHLQAPVEVADEYGRHSYDHVVHEGGHGFELVCVNADELPPLIERVGQDFFSGARIGVWGWEVNTIPERWNKAFSLIDEIWVYSQFMARNIGAAAPVPVIALPPPVQTAPRNRSSLRLGVPPGFLFLFVFDYLSTIQRKNPVGLVEAFKQAFSAGEGPQLLIKTINAPLRPYVEEEVLWAVDGRPDIHVIDRSLTGEEKDALMAACDCYVSLHRSEGFGLTLAEAMAIGQAGDRHRLLGKRRLHE